MGGETPVALDALPAPSHYIPIFTQSGIDNLIIQTGAKGTLHIFLLYS
jgi:hypothetical protein